MGLLSLINALLFPASLVAAGALLCIVLTKCIADSIKNSKYIANPALRSCYSIGLLLVACFCLNYLLTIASNLLQVAAFLLLQF